MDARILTNSAIHLYLKVSTDEYRESFDVRSRRTKGEMLNAFGVKPMALQLNAALAHFGLKDSDFNCLNAGESHENTQKRAGIFEKMMNMQLNDDGVFAATSRSDAIVFWRWLTTALPLALVDQLMSPITNSREVMERFEFELILVMLIGEL